MAFIRPQIYNIRRRSTGGYVDGVYAETADTVFTIRGGVQPTSGKELDLLDEQEGTLLRGARKLYTKALLKTVRQGDPTRCDVVEIDDGQGEGIELWEVHFVQNRGTRRYNLPTSHFKYILLRANEQNDVNT